VNKTGKNKTGKKLQIQKVVVKPLTPPQLSDVQGGGPGYTVFYCPKKSDFCSKMCPVL